MSAPADRYARVHSIMAGARDLRGAVLDAFLAEATGGDAALEHDVRRMLMAASDERFEDAFTDRSIGRARVALEALSSVSASRWMPEKIGNYTIGRQIARGGMGLVYEAIQESPQRLVAIKLLHPIHATPERLRRFRRETELLGRLQHPGIAQILEAGTFDAGYGPQPFFAMEFVQGMPLTDYADARGLTTGARLELIAELCDVLQYAHQQGVVHRDLKPANILVTTGETSSTQSSTRVSLERPKVLDFGVARAMDADVVPVTHTAEGQLVGTVQYMSPEQAEGDPQNIDARSDVYAVGVLAYEMLAGRLPFDFDGQFLRDASRILREDPSSLGSIDRALRGDIETIVAKALEKDKERRYASVADLAADIRRYLQHVPIKARPPSATYQLCKFARRNKAIVGGAVATLLVAVAGAIIAIQFAAVARARAEDLERTSYIAGLAAAHTSLEQDHYVAAARYLDRLPVARRGWEYEYLRARLAPHRDEWQVPAPVVSTPVLDGEGLRVYAVMSDKTLGAWDLAGGRLLHKSTLDVVGTEVRRSTAVLHGGSERIAVVSPSGDIVISSLAGEEQARIRPGSNDRQATVFAWDSAGRQLLYLLDDPYELFVWDGTRSRAIGSGPCTHAVFNHAADRIAVSAGGDRPNTALVDAKTGEVLARQELEESLVDLAFAPDDRTLACAGAYRNIYLLDGRTLEVTAQLIGHQDMVYGVTWNASGSLLVTISLDGTVRIWNANVPNLSLAHPSGTDRDERGPRGAIEFRSAGGYASKTVVTPDGEHVLVAGTVLRRFPLEDPHVLRGHASYVSYLAFSPDGSLLASSGFRDPEIHVWNLHQSRSKWRFHAPPMTAPWLPGGSEWDAVPLLAFSEEGRRLVAATWSGTVQWDVHSGAELPVSSNADPRARLLETLGGSRGVRLTAPRSAISADGKRIAVCQASGVVQLFEADPPLLDWWPEEPGGSFREHMDDLRERAAVVPIGDLEGHVGEVYCAAFSPDGARIATGGADNTVRIWDARTLDQLVVLRGHEQYVKDVGFSPDGTILASASGDKTIRLWDSVPLNERWAMGARR